MGIALGLTLALLAGAHVRLVWGLAGCTPHESAWRVRAAIALFVLPLAPWWGWAAGLRRTTIVWGAALALYTLGVALS